MDLPDDFNILISGRNASLTDTMIFVSINHSKKSITLISIPRDLYVKGRKINSIYSSYGLDELARQISHILGYKIDKYILIDMDIFMEIIDLIGGIDIYLDNAVIDPSYKVFDDGKWGTLAYNPGHHHLNGREALRIARSRHYSSDFDRAARQQLILEALKEKALKLGFGNADTVMKIIKTVLNKTETNISFQEALSYYFRYQNFELKRGNVLSGANVLRSTYTNFKNKDGNIEKNCKEKTSNNERELADENKISEVCEKSKGAYILLPRDGNWNLIKWYVREILGDN